jgi:hypothetical protein
MELDEIATAQDVQDPVWASELPDPAFDHPKRGHPGVRTIHDSKLDLLQEVVDEVGEWVEREGHKLPHKPDHPAIIDTRPWPAFSWHGSTFSIDEEKRIVTKRPDRFRVVITNWGPGILYLSAETANRNAASPAFVQVPPPGGGAAGTGVSQNSRQFFTQGEIWASPAIAGTAQVVDVQDEYGIPER